MVNDLLCRHDVDVAIMDEEDLQDGDDLHDDEVVVDSHDDLVEVVGEVVLEIKKKYKKILILKFFIYIKLNTSIPQTLYQHRDF